MEGCNHCSPSLLRGLRVFSLFLSHFPLSLYQRSLLSLSFSLRESMRVEITTSHPFCTQDFLACGPSEMHPATSSANYMYSVTQFLSPMVANICISMCKYEMSKSVINLSKSFEINLIRKRERERNKMENSTFTDYLVVASQSCVCIYKEMCKYKISRSPRYIFCICDLRASAYSVLGGDALTTL